MPLEFNKLGVTRDSQDDWHRTIVSLRTSIDIFAELVDDPADHEDLVAHEMATKPFERKPPVITRPFEEAEVYDAVAKAIAWPFEHPCRSRFSNGSYGVWYGSKSLETSVYETVYHFRVNTLSSDAVSSGSVVAEERRVHLVGCTAALIDLRPHLENEPELLNPNDYSVCQTIGAQLYHSALPGVLTHSVRHPDGLIIAVFQEGTLTNPRTVCNLTYYLEVDTGRVRVERELGRTWMEIPA